MLIIHSDNSTTIEIAGGAAVRSLVFLEDSKHVLSGGDDGMIRQWRVEDRTEVENQRLKASSRVEALSLSSDHNWIVSGENKVATVWNRKTRQSVLSVNEHSDLVLSVHVSPDSTKFATGSSDKSAFIWDISTGRRLFGPLQHGDWVVAVRFSPDGDCIATAVWTQELRIYDAHTGQLLRTITVALYSSITIAWSSDSHRIFTLSVNALKHIYVDTGTILSEWTIPGQSKDSFLSIALPSNGRFIASFLGRSLSFWDTSARTQLGPTFEHTQVAQLYSMALSSDNNYLATGSTNGIITLRDLNDIIPMSYLVGRNVVQRPQTSGVDVQLQIGALHDELRLLASRFGALLGNLTRAQLNVNTNQTS